MKSSTQPKTPMSMRPGRALNKKDHHPDRFRGFDLNQITLPDVIRKLRRASGRIEFIKDCVVLSIARQIRGLRVAGGISQESLSRDTGLPGIHISRLERGRSKWLPTIPTLARLAGALGYGMRIEFVPLGEVIIGRMQEQRKQPGDWGTNTLRYLDEKEDLEDMYGIAAFMEEPPEPKDWHTRNDGEWGSSAARNKVWERMLAEEARTESEVRIWKLRKEPTEGTAELDAADDGDRGRDRDRDEEDNQ